MSRCHTNKTPFTALHISFSEYIVTFSRFCSPFFIAHKPTLERHFTMGGRVAPDIFHQRWICMPTEKKKEGNAILTLIAFIQGFERDQDNLLTETVLLSSSNTAI